MSFSSGQLSLPSQPPPPGPSGSDGPYSAASAGASASAARDIPDTAKSALYAGGVLTWGDPESDLPLELLQRIENSDPALTELRLPYPDGVLVRTGENGPIGQSSFNDDGCRILAPALSLNTCITSVDLSNMIITPAGVALLCPALMRLTAMTSLGLSHTDLCSSGASHLCSTFAHLTGMTELALGYNKLTADDGARIIGAAAAAGMTRLKELDLHGNPSRENPFSASTVVGCGAWRELNLPQPPHEIMSKFSQQHYKTFQHLVPCLLSEYEKL